MEHRGSCLCGAITYVAVSDPITVVHCHCAMCRKHSGAAFLTYAAFAARDVQFTRGTPVGYRSSPEAERSHCGTCGSPIGFVYFSDPETIYVTAGSLDEPGRLKPTAHWYVRSKLDWITLSDGLQQHRTLP